MKLYPGDSLPGGYHILDIIDSGGMGTVYILGSSQSRMIWAAKTFKDKFFNNPDTVNRFMKEAEIWIKIGKHPNLVFADSVKLIEGIPFVFLEYISKGNLLPHLLKRMSVEKALNFAIQCCDGMIYLHNKTQNNYSEIIHCDLKPANILISENDRVKITDFGLIKSIDSDNETGSSDSVLLNAEGKMIAGTPPYMSPEHFSGMEKVTRASDIYCFGIILYEMIVNKYPFKIKTGSVEEFRYHHLNTEPLAPSKEKQDIPEELDGFIYRCLCKKQVDRYQTFEKVKKDLSIIYQSLTGKIFISAPSGDDKFTEGNRIARSYLNIGKAKEAVNEIDRVFHTLIDVNEKEVALNIKGRAFLELDRYQESLQCFEKAIEYDPDDGSHWNNMGLAYKGIGNYSEAIRCFNKSAELNPYDWGPLHNMGTLADEQDDRNEALNWFDRALSVNPMHVNSLSSKGNVLQKLEKYTEALECEKKAISINPRDPNTINNIIVIYLKMEQFDKALYWSDQLIELDLRHPYYWYNRASIFMQKKEFDAAIKTIEDGIEVIPDKVTILELKLQIIIEIIKMRAEPKYHKFLYETVQQILHYDPKHKIASAYRQYMDSDEHLTMNDPMELDRKGELLLNIGRTSEAIPYLEKAIALDPKFMSPHNNLGLAMELLGHLNKAMEYYSKAIQIDPHHFMPYYNLGNCYKQQGKFFHAIEQYNNSISNNDRFINTWIALSSCYFELREIENCKKALSKAHELEPMHPMVQQNIQIINSTFGVEFF